MRRQGTEEDRSADREAGPTSDRGLPRRGDEAGFGGAAVGTVLGQVAGAVVGGPAGAIAGGVPGATVGGVAGDQASAGRSREDGEGAAGDPATAPGIGTAPAEEPVSPASAGARRERGLPPESHRGVDHDG